MERCPYCNAAIRSGARFCTSCGRRLTPAVEEQSAASQGSGSPEPVAAAPAAWESPVPVERPPAPADEWIRRAPLGSADLWPASARSAEPTAEASPPAATPAEEPAPAVEVAESGEVEDRSAWPTSPWASWTMPETVETGAGAAESVTESVAEPVVEPAAEDGVVDGAVAAPESGELEAGAAELAVPVLPETAVEPVVSVAGPARGETDASGGDPLGRALSLVAELQALLPAVAGAAGIDLAGARGTLEAARSESAAVSGEELASLERALVTARERPREIDTLLRLADRLDDLVATVATARTLRSAVDQAIALLGGVTERDTARDG